MLDEYRLYTTTEYARREGIKEGKEEGIKEGKKEGKEEIARNMLADNVPPAMIAKYTGLSPEAIQALQTQ